MWTYHLIENCPEDFDILTSALKPGCREISSPRHAIHRSNYLWDSIGDNPSSLDLFVSYSFMFFWVFSRLATGRYEAVIAGAFPIANGILFLLGKLLKVPVIGLAFAEEFTLALRGKGAKNFIKRQWTIFAHSKAAGFVTVCGFCKDILVSLGIDSSKIIVIPPMIDSSRFNEVTRGYGAGHRILSVGRLVERKGFHLLINAVKKLKPGLPGIQLTIIGDGPFKKRLLDQVQSCGLEDCVFIRTGVSDEELSEAYRTSDLFVLAHFMLENGDTEGCPTVFSEASGNGLPVIGGIEGGASSIIADGVTGFLVDPRRSDELEDRIRRILTTPDLAKTMGEAGRIKITKEHQPAYGGFVFGNFLRAVISGGS